MCHKFIGYLFQSWFICEGYWWQTPTQRQRRLKQAAFPFHKTLISYDFSLMPSLNKNRFLTMFKVDFVEKRENIIFLGNSGTGKSHLATGIGIEVI
ncbi:ATP-binding protein [Rossellomorea aquimaris]|uniref:ATP-binding protein n=1 Tax=Rossellomorea aquimaris TaxID=189382 RepID=UPI0037C9FB63